MILASAIPVTEHQVFQLAARARRLLVVTATTALVGACSNSSNGGAVPDAAAGRPRAPAELMPDRVQVPAGKLILGTGARRTVIDLPHLQISKFPTTVGQYRRCVDAGACTAPGWQTKGCQRKGVGIWGQTYGLTEGNDDLPVTCSTPEQAANFCDWHGGRLPTFEEWTFAARGSDPHPYSWGDVPPSCDQHRLAPTADGRPCDDPKRPAVGKHPKGASPFGVEDILLTPAELIAHGAKSHAPACKMYSRGCEAITLPENPGVIDFIVGLPERDVNVPIPDDGLATAGFRCVWSEASK
jgi:formylglycine-generating enzyme required for sulfatase activity